MSPARGRTATDIEPVVNGAKRWWAGGVSARVLNHPSNFAVLCNCLAVLCCGEVHNAVSVSQMLGAQILEHNLKLRITPR